MFEASPLPSATSLSLSVQSSTLADTAPIGELITPPSTPPEADGGEGGRVFVLVVPVTGSPPRDCCNQYFSTRAPRDNTPIRSIPVAGRVARKLSRLWTTRPDGGVLRAAATVRFARSVLYVRWLIRSR